MIEPIDGIEYRIQEALEGFDFGATGAAKIEHTSLYCRREENCAWQHVAIVGGGVAPDEVDDAREAIADYFWRRGA
jgi:hypothetical protein